MPFSFLLSFTIEVTPEEMNLHPQEQILSLRVGPILEGVPLSMKVNSKTP